MIRNRLKNILKRRHLTIKDLIIKAKRKGLKLSPSNVYKFTGNQTNTYRINLIDNICKTLHINVNQLIYSIADNNAQFQLKRVHIKYPQAKFLINRNNQKRKIKPFIRHICNYRFTLKANKNKSTSFVLIILKHSIIIGISPKNKLSMYLLNPFILEKIAIKSIHQELSSITKFSNKFKNIHFDIFANKQNIRKLWYDYTFHPKTITDNYLDKHLNKLNKKIITLNAKYRMTVKDQEPNREFKEYMVPHINKRTDIFIKPLVDIGYSDPNKVINKARNNKFNNIYPYKKYNAISGSFCAKALNNTHVVKLSNFIKDPITDSMYKTKKNNNTILIFDAK